MQKNVSISTIKQFAILLESKETACYVESVCFCQKHKENSKLRKKKVNRLIQTPKTSFFKKEKTLSQTFVMEYGVRAPARTLK